MNDDNNALLTCMHTASFFVSNDNRLNKQFLAYMYCIHHIIVSKCKQKVANHYNR